MEAENPKTMKRKASLEMEKLCSKNTLKKRRQEGKYKEGSKSPGCSSRKGPGTQERSQSCKKKVHK